MPSVPFSVHGVEQREAARRIGSLAQLARIDRFSEEDGPARGARRMRLITGGGLEVDIHPDRALDIGQVTVNGVPISWISSGGIGSPHAVDNRGTEWLRTFGGGLLTTCGLDTIGPPSFDRGVDYPMHGRINSIPALVSEVSVSESVLRVAGEIRQTRVFAENLTMRRAITAPLGGTEFTVYDTVTNESSQPSGHLMLYHANFGWPLIEERACLDIPSQRVRPRDAVAEKGVARWHEIEPPQEHFAEQVFLHEFDVQEGRAIIDNSRINMRCEVSFDATSMPALHQWKMAGVGTYVLGLEPANVGHIQGRAEARKERALPVLEAGESVDYSLTFRFSQSERAS